MLKTTLYSAVLTVLLLVFSIPDVTSYNKYGRNCKDIGCRSDEVCVIVEDPCTIYSQDKCGRYPTCKRTNTGEAGCESIVCPPNDYCKTENGVPKCVSKTASNGFESAGVDIVNGQRVSSSDTNKHYNPNTNTNPYSNANAPPLPVDPSIPVNFGNNLGYPGFHNNPGTPNNNNGYPPYPSTNQGNQPRTDNLGYPPYPTQNKMPQPGHGYPPYPGRTGYPQTEDPYKYLNGQRYPVGQYPTYPNYPNQNHKVYSTYPNPIRQRNGAVGQSASLTIVWLINLVVILHRLVD